jgi:hypothetical protein
MRSRRRNRASPDGPRRRGPVRVARKTLASSSRLRLRASMLQSGSPIAATTARERYIHTGVRDESQVVVVMGLAPLMCARIRRSRRRIIRDEQLVQG